MDFSSEIVEYVNSLNPGCSIKVGDVRKLEYPDDSFSAYISLGVVEHFPDGPEEILREAWRILRPGGLMVISVPRVSPLRRMKAMLGSYSGTPSGDFYQYMFGCGEFSRFLRNTSFLIRCVNYYDAPRGLRQEIPLFERLHGRKKIPQLVLKILDGSHLSNWLFSHIILFVAEKSRD